MELTAARLLGMLDDPALEERSQSLVAEIVAGPERESVLNVGAEASAGERVLRDWVLSEQEFRQAGEAASEGRAGAALGWGLLGLAGAIPLAGQGVRAATKALDAGMSVARAADVAGDVARVVDEPVSLAARRPRVVQEWEIPLDEEKIFPHFDLYETTFDTDSLDAATGAEVALMSKTLSPQFSSAVDRQKNTLEELGDRLGTILPVDPNDPIPDSMRFMDTARWFQDEILLPKRKVENSWGMSIPELAIDDELRALLHWKYVGNDNVQSLLRTGKMPKFYQDEHLREKAETTIEYLDAMLGASTKSRPKFMDNPVVVYRGVSDTSLAAQFGDEKVELFRTNPDSFAGVEFVDKAFFTGSINPNIALNFANAKAKNFATIFRIEIDAKDKAVPVDLLVDRVGSKFSHENEIILPRNLSLRIDSVVAPWEVDEFMPYAIDIPYFVNLRLI